MDDKEVTQEETNIAIRLAAASRIAYITVLANSRTEKEPLRTLNLASTIDVLMTQSLNKPVKLNEDDKQWLSRVIFHIIYVSCYFFLFYTSISIKISAFEILQD